MANGINWIGIDDSAGRWTIAHFVDGSPTPEREFELTPGESGYRKLIGWIKGLEGEVRVVYEAGPCGYELYRNLRKKKIVCEVAAPSLTPRRAGERVKTNRRDAAKLAKLYRAGELTLISVPDAEHEALRDLVRARRSVQRDVLRARQHVQHLLLRQGQHRYREGGAWTQRHWTWLRGLELPHADTRAVLHEMLKTLRERIEQLARYDELLEEAAHRPRYAAYVAALKTLRGVNTLTALGIVAEMGDLRRYTSAPQLMAAAGLVPSEYSTGEKTKRFGITKTGNATVRHLAIEAAWHYRRALSEGTTLQKRRKDQPEQIVSIARRCDARLHRRFGRLTSRGKTNTVAVVAVARELIGFIWSIGQQFNVNVQESY